MLATVTSDGRPARAGWGPVSGGSPPAAAGGNLTSSPALYGPPSGARLRPGARRRLAAAGPRRRARRRAGAWLADFTVALCRPRPTPVQGTRLRLGPGPRASSAGPVPGFGWLHGGGPRAVTVARAGGLGPDIMIGSPSGSAARPGHRHGTVTVPGSHGDSVGRRPARAPAGRPKLQSNQNFIVGKHSSSTMVENSIKKT